MSASLAAAAAGLLALARPAASAPPEGGEGTSSVLWLPAPSFSDWSALEETLARSPKARITVGLDPDEIPAQARPLLGELLRQGRLEAALRLSGNPLLGLLQRQRPQNLAERLAVAKTKYRQMFGAQALGFVPSRGALTPQAASTLAGLGLRWSAAGDSVSTTPWVSAGGLLVIPFHAVSSTQPLQMKPGEPPRAIVLDESEGLLPPGAGLGLMRDLFSAGFFSSSQNRWATVAEGFLLNCSTGPAPSFWPNWSGEDMLASGDPLREKALTLAAQAAAALERYQNSGIARLGPLNKASDALYAAQASRFFQNGALADPALDKEFRARLKDVFKALRQNFPEELLSPLNSGAFAPSGPPGEEERELSGRIRSGAGPDRIWFENPQEPALPAENNPPLTPGATIQDPWSPKKLEVAWDESNITFTLSMKKIENLNSAPFGFSPLMLDIYIDLNHLAGRGSTALLPERKGFLRAVDAWEYVLVLTGFGGALYRASPGQAPALVERASLVCDPNLGEIRASIPRLRLRGNPAGWGYLVLALATDSARARLEIPLPLPEQGQGGPVLGLLGDREDQQMLREEKSQFLRFSALRISKETDAAGDR